jgi:hypothetical protein
LDGVAWCPILVFETEGSIDLHEQVDNTTGGKKSRIAGNEDFSATIEENNRTPSLAVGQNATIMFDNGEYEQTEYIIVERRRQGVDINAGTPVTWSYDVLGDVEGEVCSSSS